MGIPQILVSTLVLFFRPEVDATNVKPIPSRRTSGYQSAGGRPGWRAHGLTTRYKGNAARAAALPLKGVYLRHLRAFKYGNVVAISTALTL